MLWKPLLLLLILTASILSLIPLAHANPYYLTNPQYFNSLQGSYIYFPSSVLPQNFSNWYYDGQKNWFNDTVWLTTTKTITITAWFTSNWLNYTVTATGTQQIHNGSEPTSIFIDGIEEPEGTGWTYSSGTITITLASVEADIYYGSVPDAYPTYSDIGYNTTEISQPCKFSSKWTDDNGLSKYIFSTNNTGTWTNDTAVSFSGNPAWANVTKTLNSTAGLVIGFRWYANDTANQWNVTTVGILTLILTDVGFPVATSISYSSTIVETSCLFRSYWTDDVALDMFLLSYDLGVGSFSNTSWTSFSGTPGWAQWTLTLPSNVSMVIRFKFYANDTANHVTMTSVTQFLTTAEAPPAPSDITGTETTYYLTNDLVTVNGVVGYQLSPTKPTTATYTTKNYTYSSTSNLPITWGWRVWITNQLNESTEVTNGLPTAFLNRAINGTGWQASTYTVPTKQLIVGYSALKLIVYLRFGYTGTWNAKATFTTPRILQNQLLTSTWTFNMWTEATYTTSGPDKIMEAKLLFGSNTYDSNIDNVLFHEPAPGEIQLYLFSIGDFIGALFYPWTQFMGNLFYVFAMFIVGMTLYRRGQSINVILVFFALFGGGTGILTAILPIGALNIVWLFLVVSIAILLFRLFRDR